MTEPEQPPGNYASDRHLLLQEIKALAREVGKLRGDTKYLNEVTVPREEHRRRRKVTSVLAGLSLLLFSLVATGLYIQSQELDRTQQQIQQASYEECQSERAAAERSAAGFVEINALLNSLRDARQSLINNPLATPAGRAVATKEVAAYERYLAFVEKNYDQRMAQTFDCDQYLTR